MQIENTSPLEGEKRVNGKGLYVFKNILHGLLTLPKPAISGKREIAGGEEFTGDNSFMRFVKYGMASLVREIRSPEQEQEMMVTAGDYVLVCSGKGKSVSEAKERQKAMIPLLRY